MNERSKMQQPIGLGEVFWTTAAATVMPVIGIGFAARGALVGLSRLRRGGSRAAAGALLATAMLAMLAQIGHAQYLKALLGGREMARQAICATRLKGMGKAIALYMTSYNDHVPSLSVVDDDGRVRFPRRIDADPKAVGGASKTQALKKFWQTQGDCNLQHAYLLVENAFCGEDQFQCPSDKKYKGADRGEGEIGFDSWRNSSYAFQPFTLHEDNAAAPGLLGQDGGVLIAADKQIRGKHVHNLNHPDGMNTLSLNSAVVFKKNQFNMVGWNGNHAFNVDIDEKGDLLTEPGKVTSKVDIPDKGTPLPVYINDSALFWKEDGEKLATAETSDTSADASTGGDTTAPDEDDGRPSWQAAATREADSDVAEEGRTKALPEAAPAPQPSDTPIWTILLICLGVGAAIGVALAVWWTVREKKAKP